MHQRVAIIGAGMAGLTLAHKLRAQFDCVIFDKSRGVGGRITTRRAPPFQFDHGAQFFQAKTKTFNDFIQPMLDQGIITPWCGTFAEITKNKTIYYREWNNSPPHYVGVPGMSAIGKFLAQSCEINLNKFIKRLLKEGDKWTLYDDEGKPVGQFDWVIVTSPVAQARTLLPNHFLSDNLLDNINMESCYSLMLGFDKPFDLGFQAALVNAADISWISVNSSKPGRSAHPTLLVHSTNQWADRHIEYDLKQAQAYLMRETKQVLGHELEHCTHQKIHRWRYANIARQKRSEMYFDSKEQIACCGDWCIQGRIESAFLSALALANEMLKETDIRSNL